MADRELQLYTFTLPLHPTVNKSKQQIRLLNILPQAENESEIKCKLSVFDLPECPPYIALSYVWDSVGETHSFFFFFSFVKTNSSRCARICLLNFRTYLDISILQGKRKVRLLMSIFPRRIKLTSRIETVRNHPTANHEYGNISELTLFALIKRIFASEIIKSR